MKRLSIVAQLGLGFGLVLAVLVLVVTVSVAKQRELAGFTIRQHEHPFTVSNAVARADANAARSRRVLAEVMLARTSEEVDALAAELERLNKLTLDDLHLAKSRFLGDKSDFERLIELHASTAPLWAKVIEAKRHGDDSAALHLLRVDAQSQGDSLSAAHRKVYEFALAKAEEFQVSAKRSRDGAIALTVLLGVGAVIGAVTAAVVCTRMLSRPLEQAVAVAGAISRGDLRTARSAEGSNETARLLGSLHQMQQSLSGVVSAVRRSADSVVAASAEIERGNRELANRTEQGASALEQTAATMEELGSTAKLTAENALRASDLAQGASKVASDGGRVVQEVVATMRDISASSKRIADIIAVIDGIAFQTNILALNASVEAARAGEQGRGFAVVAGEVRTLAQRSAEAAGEIRTLILGSVERMESGSALAERAGKTMNDVVGSIHRVSVLVDEISGAAAEQSAGVGEVGAAVSTLDKATQQNSALVRDGAAAAAQLRLQAQGLAAAVGVFQLPEVAGRPFAGQASEAASLLTGGSDGRATISSVPYPVTPDPLGNGSEDAPERANRSPLDV